MSTQTSLVIQVMKWMNKVNSDDWLSKLWIVLYLSQNNINNQVLENRSKNPYKLLTTFSISYKIWKIVFLEQPV